MWRRPPSHPAVGEGGVHVWRLDLDVDPVALERFAHLLTPEEKERAGRFRFGQDRRRWTAARGRLRTVLSRYLAVEPRRVELGYGAFGKPYLKGAGPAGDLRFNLAHSGDQALLALALGREIGIDIEQIRPVPDFEDLARRFFSSRETTMLLSLPGHQRLKAFLTCWTRKEAYIKARGGGLAVALSGFDVSFAPGEPPALLRSKDGIGETHHWELMDIPAGSGFAAALAVECQSHSPPGTKRLGSLTGKFYLDR